MKTNQVIPFIVDWLETYAKNAKVNGFVIGVSGGVDSAVTSTLCAMTGLEVMCLEMPIHQSESHVSRAQEHITQLEKKFPNVQSTRVNLSPVFDGFKNEIDLQQPQATVDMALANSRARLRMTTLYYYAGILGRLVAGTGNKVEDFGVGFYTKYGDGGVDISPIGDCNKSTVWSLGRYLGILKEIIEAPPTDGLWSDGRNDEDQLGMTYEELEKAMNDKNDPNYKKYLEIRKKNLHKMNPIPVCKFDDL